MTARSVLPATGVDTSVTSSSLSDVDAGLAFCCTNCGEDATGSLTGIVTVSVAVCVPLVAVNTVCMSACRGRRTRHIGGIAAVAIVGRRAEGQAVRQLIDRDRDRAGCAVDV